MRHAKAELDAHWDRLTGRHPGEAETLEVKGRGVRVPLASMGIARFAFAELCEAPLGTIDYLRIAHTYHTVMIDGIPVHGSVTGATSRAASSTSSTRSTTTRSASSPRPRPSRTRCARTMPAPRRSSARPRA